MLNRLLQKRRTLVDFVHTLLNYRNTAVQFINAAFARAIIATIIIHDSRTRLADCS